MYTVHLYMVIVGEDNNKVQGSSIYMYMYMYTILCLDYRSSCVHVILLIAS